MAVEQARYEGIDAVAFAGIGQTLISAVLIFLMALAIRNHFRIK